jgi:hypothetical protein
MSNDFIVFCPAKYPSIKKRQRIIHSIIISDISAAHERNRLTENEIAKNGGIK